MKVVCISNLSSYRGKSPLTIGKVYETTIVSSAIKHALGYWPVLDNTGNYAYYERELFISIEEHRANQIDKIVHEI